MTAETRCCTPPEHRRRLPRSAAWLAGLFALLLLGLTAWGQSPEDELRDPTEPGRDLANRLSAGEASYGEGFGAVHLPEIALPARVIGNGHAIAIIEIDGRRVSVLADDTLSVTTDEDLLLTVRVREVSARAVRLFFEELDRELFLR